MQVSEKTVVNHELRLIVETSQTTMPFMAHITKTQDVKGYLIIVDLSSKAPLAQRSKVYGPLWDVPQPRSELSFSAGVNFTKEDLDATLATPHSEFDESGNLVRFRNDLANHKVLFDVFDLPTKTWKQQTAFTPIDNQSQPMSEDQVICPSGRYMLLYQNKAAKLFDLYTGQEKADTWLTDRFAEARQIPKFENVSTLLTDDLNHLVVSPRVIWNEGFGAAVHDTFDFAGKTFSRAKYFLAADRPEPSLGLVPRAADEQQFLKEAPSGAYTIDNQLMLMYATKNAIRLYKRDGTVVYHSEAKVPAGWANGALGTRHLASEGKLVFFNVDLDQMEDRHIAFTMWDYRDGEVTNDIIPIVDLFREDSDHYIIRGEASAVK